MFIFRDGIDLFTLIPFVPIILSFIVIFRRFDRDNKVWLLIILAAILFAGSGAILVSLVHLFFSRHKLVAESRGQLVPASSLPANTETLTPEVQAQMTKNRMVAGGVLGTLITVVLAFAGIAIVGFFVLMTAISISCANDPKCM